MSTLKVNSIEPANTGQENYYLPRAWVNFNGELTVAIRSSGNVSSVTDGGIGDYGVNFSNNLTGANYATSLSCIGVLNHPNASCSVKDDTIPSTSTVEVTTGNNGGAGSTGQVKDADIVSVVVTL